MAMSYAQNLKFIICSKYINYKMTNDVYNSKSVPCLNMKQKKETEEAHYD